MVCTVKSTHRGSTVTRQRKKSASFVLALILGGIAGYGVVAGGLEAAVGADDSSGGSDQSAMAPEPDDLDDFGIPTSEIPGAKPNPTSGSEFRRGLSMAEIRQELGLDGKPKDVNVIGSAGAPAELLAQCRADEHAVPSCGIALAVADGSLSPGTYTDAELQAAVADAGYTWKPAQ